MENENVLKIIKHDYESAKSAKKTIDDKIVTWLNEYDGKPYGSEKAGYSKIVIKDIKKAVESFIPNAVEPFVVRNRIVSLTGITGDDVQPARIHQNLLNYQFIRNFDRYNFIHDMFKVGATEGTTIIRCGWDYEDKEEETIYDNLLAEELEYLQTNLQPNQTITDIEDNQNGSYNVTVTTLVVVKNHPTAKVEKNEKVFIDPSATNIEDANFVIVEFDSTPSELKQTGLYDNDKIDKLMSNLDDENGSLNNERRNEQETKGMDNRYESKDPSLKKITVKEYWGNVDIDEDGKAEPVVIAYINNVIIRQEDNPYPDKEKPFILIPFIRSPFNLWGSPLAEFLSDNQKIRTSLMRGIIDNVAKSNNGRKFYRKGAIDAVNKRKLENGISSSIEVNGDRNDMWDGAHNEIPATIFNLLEVIQTDSENLSGITRYAQGLDASAFNSTATGVATVTSMSQKRMIEIIRRYSEGLKQVFRKWISYNKVFLTEEEVIRIAGDYIPFRKDDISGAYDIDITVGIDGVQENKANQVSMLMQQVGSLQGVVPPDMLRMLLAKLADLWNFADVSEALEEYQPEPNPMAEEAQRLDLSDKQADIALKDAKMQESLSKAAKNHVDSKINTYSV